MAKNFMVSLGLAALGLMTASAASAAPQETPSGSAAVEPSASASVPTAVPKSLSQRLAEGAHYVLVTRRDLFPRASQGLDLWFTIEGYFRASDGIWTSRASGFPSPGTPWHSCPAQAQCGGIHEPGMVLERWYRPENREMVVIGQRLTFDQDGRVFHNGRQIGVLLSPEF